LLALPFRPVTAGVLYLPASFLLFRQKFGLYVMPGTRKLPPTLSVAFMKDDNS
jgi:hypothetical protein